MIHSLRLMSDRAYKLDTAEIGRKSVGLYDLPPLHRPTGQKCKVGMKIFSGENGWHKWALFVHNRSEKRE